MSSKIQQDDNKPEEKYPPKIDETNKKPEFPPLDKVRDYTIIPGRHKGGDFDL